MFSTFIVVAFLPSFSSSALFLFFLPLLAPTPLHPYRLMIITTTTTVYDAPSGKAQKDIRMSSLHPPQHTHTHHTTPHHTHTTPHHTTHTHTHTHSHTHNPHKRTLMILFQIFRASRRTIRPDALAAITQQTTLQRVAGFLEAVRPGTGAHCPRDRTLHGRRAGRRH